MNNNSDSLSSILTGQHLTEVDFVMDYLRLRFDHCYLTIMADAILKTPKGDLHQNSGEFCVELINCNGKEVKEAYLIKDKYLSVIFENKCEFFVSMTSEDYTKENYVLSEAVTLNHDDGRWWVW
jgi:hypothetical protein